MEFKYTDDLSSYRNLLNTRVVDKRCKHVLDTSNEKAEQALKESKKIGYNECHWGMWHEGYTSIEESRLCNLDRVRRRIYKCVITPMRVVICLGGSVWIDNLHNALVNVLVFGESVRLRDIPFYIVDLSENDGVPVVVDVFGSLKDSVRDIKGAIDSAKYRDDRVNEAICECNYRLKDFMKDNNITLESLNVDSDMLEAYKDKFNRVFGFEIVS